MCLIFLQVWYAPHYAERFGFPQLDITDQDIQSECMCKTNIHVYMYVVLGTEAIEVVAGSKTW